MRSKLIFCLLIVNCFFVNSCNKVKDWLNEGQMIGFWGTNYISPNFSKDVKDAEGKFIVEPNEVYALRLVFEMKEPGEFRKTGDRLADFELEDQGQMKKVIDSVQDIEITIKNDKEKIKIITEDILKENTGDFGYINDKNIMQQIDLASINLQNKNYTISIHAPNIDFKDWTVRFVLGTGAAGSELIW